MTGRLVLRSGRVKDALAACGATLLLATAAAGQSRNAAEWYAKAFDRLDAVDVTEQGWRAVLDYRPVGGTPPTAEVRSTLARLQPVFSAVHRGAGQRDSDFRLDRGAGYALQLPHLGRLRRISRLMSQDALVRLHDGDRAGAARATAALYRLSNHVGQDGVLVSSLVGQAIFDVAEDLATAGIDRAAYGPAETSVVLDAVRTLDPDDPFNVIGAIADEKSGLIEWIREQYADAGQRAWMFDDLQLDAGAADTVAGLMMLDDRRFESALHGADAVVDQVVEIFELADPGEAELELARIEAEIRRGEHGPLAPLLAPNYGRIHERLVESRERVAERAALLRAIVDGTVPPGALANAGVWYLRAVRLVEELPEAARARLRASAGGTPGGAPDDGTEQVVNGADPIIEALRTGSRQRRCSFEFARSQRDGVVPWYLEGLRDAARLLCADARRRLAAGEPQPAADRLATAFVLSAHLADEPELFTSLVSHATFAAAADLSAWGREGLAAEQRATLLRAVRRTSFRDPFGYQRAIRRARHAVVERLGLHDEARRRAVRTSRRLTPQQVLFLAVVTADDGVPAATGPALWDLLSQPALEEAREARPALLEALSAGDLGLVDGAVAGIAPLDERVEQARADVQRVVRALE